MAENSVSDGYGWGMNGSRGRETSTKKARAKPAPGEEFQEKSSASGTDTARLRVSGNQNSTNPATTRTNTKERSSLAGTSILASLGIVIRQPVPIGEATVGISLARIPACSLLLVPSSTSPAAPSSSHSRRILVRLLIPAGAAVELSKRRYRPAVTTRRQQSIESFPARCANSLRREGRGIRSPSKFTGVKSTCCNSFPSITSLLTIVI